MTVDTFTLEGKVAIVTGSARESGIGAGIAQALARNGAWVTIGYVSESSGPKAEVVAKKIRDAGGKCTIIRADISIPEEAKMLVAKTLEAFGTDTIDILVNNAGLAWPLHTLDATKEDIEKHFGTNVFGTIYLTQATVPHMKKGGRIVNISSIAAKRGMDQIPIYGATKAAIDSLSFTWAMEFGRAKGITVNSVAPGPVVTDIIPEGNEEFDKSWELALTLTRAEHRAGTVTDIADAVLLVVQEKSRWITGQHISATGGITGQ